MARSTIKFGLFSLVATAHADSVVHWDLPSTADNTQAVAQGYLGFGIEMKSFPDFAGQDAPNQFSNYMLYQLHKRTNAPVHIRVGGTSMDNSHYNASDDRSWHATGKKECRLHREVTLGKPWLAMTFGNLNSSFTRYTLDVPLARLDKNNGIDFAKACINAMPNKTSQLDAVEIGNEPNLYTSYPKPSCAPKTDRPSGWNVLDYAREWRTYAKNLTNHIQLLEGSGRKDWFQGLSLSSGYKSDEWNLNAERWSHLTQGGYLKTISQHYYQTGAEGSLTDYPPDHQNTVNVLETKFRHNINFLHNNRPATPFILGEVGTVLSDSNKNPNQKLFNTLASALWTLDFLLYSMNMGVERVSMQMGTSFAMSAWRPVATKSVHANFYGLVAAADFIGTKGNLKIKPLATDGHPNVAGYAGFHDGKLATVAVLNMNFWERTAGEQQRPRREIRLTGLASEVKRVKVLRLSAPGGATDSSVHWAGRRWTAENDGKEYQDGQKPLTTNVSNGAPVRNVDVGPSEAVLVEILSN